MSGILFFSFFVLYLSTVAPHLAPYRDAGEMAALLGTLGVAHPPGYPLYTLLGSLITWLPVGNLVYRVNVFSALCAAGALVFLFHALRTWLGRPSALLVTCFFGLSNPFWDLATVSEMYTLGVLWFCALLYVTFRLKNPLLFSFLMTLGLGVRMDMLLLIPLFLVWFYFTTHQKDFPLMGLFFSLGASVFLYLMVRSLSDPVIDWANPDHLAAVFNSARRKNYSGTLDLLSLSYAVGENFFTNLKIYARHILQVFGWAGAALSLYGWVVGYRRYKPVTIFLATIFLVTGPVFLFLANMPPNPHSLAIVEASYLLPDLMIAIMVGFGWQGMTGILQNKGRSLFMGIVMVGSLTVNAVTGYWRASKRHNFYARDFVENVFRSTPRGAVAVFHKDVQLFSLWSAQLLDQKRLDVSVVATGLSGSPWYWEMKRRWKAALSPEISLKDPQGWPQLLQVLEERPLVAGYDVELVDYSRLKVSPNGMLMRVQLSDSTFGKSLFDINKWGHLLSDFCVYRGEYIYGSTPDFFSTDLIGNVARAHHQQAFYLMNQNHFDLAETFFRRSEKFDPTFSRATSDRAYLAFRRGNIQLAAFLYEEATRKALQTLTWAFEFKSLPEVLRGCQIEAASLTTQWGAMMERLGKMGEARRLYVRANEIFELAQAHYNLAVSYWEKDWGLVVRHMQRALELNPQMQEAKKFLARAEYMQGKK
ncbi:MAG: hypothetical protein KCHDKBKB_00374 [Elusimicrobia bacterium]|nr:hypothetical protein [Elusimicrobiota bacterium]